MLRARGSPEFVWNLAGKKWGGDWGWRLEKDKWQAGSSRGPLLLIAAESAEGLLKRFALYLVSCNLAPSFPAVPDLVPICFCANPCKMMMACLLCSGVVWLVN